MSPDRLVLTVLAYGVVLVAAMLRRSLDSAVEPKAAWGQFSPAVDTLDITPTPTNFDPGTQT